MNAGFALLCVAALAAVAGLASALVGALLVATSRLLARRAPAAQARLLLAAAVAPAFAAVALVSAWVVDIHVLGCSAHQCAHDHRAPLPGAVASLLAAGLAARVAWAAGRAGAGVVRTRAVRRALDALAVRGPGGCALLPLAEPQAFVLGLLRPRVYVSRGLLAAAPSVESVLAHEAAHARRRDPLRRLCASLALALHLPGVGAALERALARAQELAADAEAAGAVGDAPRIAEALVRLARLRVAPPAVAVGWHGGADELAARVDALLDERVRPDRPRAAALAGAALLGWGAALVAADPLHRGAELLLRLLDP
jgi:Zn-dependent protease with chaperone function